MSDRTVAAARALAAAIITIAGIYGFNMPIGDEMLYSVIVAAIYLITEAIIWWKNNNWTHEASTAQVILDALKSGDEEVAAAVDEIIAGIHERSGVEDAE